MTCEPTYACPGCDGAILLIECNSGLPVSCPHCEHEHVAVRIAPKVDFAAAEKARNTRNRYHDLKKRLRDANEAIAAGTREREELEKKLKTRMEKLAELAANNKKLLAAMEARA